MIREEIVLGNKLIAEFMELPKREGIARPGIDVYVYNGEKLYSDLEYHSSWNWLMPVVEKINNLPLIKGIVLPQASQKEQVIECLMTTDKEKIWYSVIQFIKWYSKAQGAQEGDASKADSNSEAGTNKKNN